MAMQKYLDGVIAESNASRVAVWAKEESVVNAFEEPGATDLCLVNAANPANQAAEMQTSAAIDPDAEGSPGATVKGPTDEGTFALELDIRPPTTLAGTDDMMGAIYLENLLGADRRYVAGQVAVDIDAVQSYSLAFAELDITATATDYVVGDGLKFISQNTATAAANGLYCAVTQITDLGGGSVRLRVEPGPLHRPIVTGTADQLQGSTTFVPSATWVKTMTQMLRDGHTVDTMIGTKAISGSLGINRRDILTMSMQLECRQIVSASQDQIRGDATTDAFVAGDTVLKLGDASRQMTGIPESNPGVLVNIEKYTVATGALAATETKAKITAAVRATNLGTLERGSGAVAATDLIVGTSTQEVIETYDTQTSSKNLLRLAVDNRPAITITLTAGGAVSAATIVADINAALRDSQHYGRYKDGMFEVDWSVVASVAAGPTVRLTSPLFGSQSRIVVSALATNSAHDIIFTGAFDISATDEMQIVPWVPGGSETRLPIHGKDGLSRINGYVIGESDVSISIDRQREVLNNNRRGADLIDGFIPGITRATSAELTMPATQWAGGVRRMINDEDTFSFMWQVGTTRAFAIFMRAAKIGSPAKEGDNRRTIKLGVAPQKSTQNSVTVYEVYAYAG